jgi:hypothetical protein
MVIPVVSVSPDTSIADGGAIVCHVVLASFFYSTRVVAM